ncbi:MAG: ribbon-helix-helix domain-containing protein [Phycisphaerales bacterium]
MAQRSYMRIGIPISLREWVASRVKAGEYADPGEYLSELIRLDQRRRAHDQLADLLESSLASGPPRAMTTKDRASLRTMVRDRAARRPLRKKSA